MAEQISETINVQDVENSFNLLSKKEKMRFSYSHFLLVNIKPLLENFRSKMLQYVPQGPSVWLPVTLLNNIKQNIRAIRVQLNREKSL